MKNMRKRFRLMQSFEWRFHLASFEFMVAGCKNDLYDSEKDNCDGSGLSASESSKITHPFHFVKLVA